MNKKQAKTLLTDGCYVRYDEGIDYGDSFYVQVTDATVRSIDADTLTHRRSTTVNVVEVEIPKGSYAPKGAYRTTPRKDDGHWARQGVHPRHGRGRVYVALRNLDANEPVFTDERSLREHEDAERAAEIERDAERQQWRTQITEAREVIEAVIPEAFVSEGGGFWTVRMRANTLLDLMTLAGLDGEASVRVDRKGLLRLAEAAKVEPTIDV